MLTRLVASLSVSLVLLVACDDDPRPAAPVESPSAASPSPSASEALPSPVDSEPFDPTRIVLGTTEVADGFEAPVGLAHAEDGSGRLYVVEQGGRIRYLNQERDAPEPFLDISDRVTAGGEQGLLGLAFHPRFEVNDRFFVNYTDTEGDTVVSEFRATETGADPGSERVLLSIDQPYPNHNGGDLAFGPDGFLYIASGDGGSAGDPNNNGQRLDALLGKLLRIDVNGRTAGEYAIPEGNPFSGDPAARPEIWAYGLRNPWQFSFDHATGDLWIADVGQSSQEEVNRASAGSAGGINYGWRVVEGTQCYEDAGCEVSDFTAPVVTYSHDFGCSITGGYVYRGDRFSSLYGAYVMADYCSGNVWALPMRIKGSADPEPLLVTELGITSFGEDEAGELYLTDAFSGTIHRVTARVKP